MFKRGRSKIRENVNFKDIMSNSVQLFRNIIRYAEKKISAYKFKRQSHYWTNYVQKDFKNINVPGKVAGENEYIQRWKIGDYKPSPVIYRCYSSYFENEMSMDFAPADMLFPVILKILNPVEHRVLFSDKNIYDKRYDSSLLPETHFRKMNGFVMSSDYKPIEIDDSFFLNLAKITDDVIVKPAIFSRGGSKVERFIFTGKYFENDKKIRLGINYLDKVYKDNYIVQQRIEQHSILNQLNESSLNTLRVLTYRSVIDNEVKILGTYLRFGNPGSVVDNVTAGGYALHVNDKGKLADFAINTNLSKMFYAGPTRISEIDDYPNYDQIVSVSKEIANLHPYQRVVGLDVVLDKQNCVKLIEVNTYNMDGFQTCGWPYFGEYTDEVIDYCRQQIQLDD